MTDTIYNEILIKIEKESKVLKDNFLISENERNRIILKLKNDNFVKRSFKDILKKFYFMLFNISFYKKAVKKFIKFVWKIVKRILRK